MVDSIKTAALYTCETDYLQTLFLESEYPWEILPRIEDHIRTLLETGIPGFREIRPGVLAGEDVVIHSSAVILGHAIIGSGTELRPGAFLRGSVITGCGCVIGNSTEVKNAVLLNRAQIPHYNYAGDSILGNRAHLGAGAVCSNLKADGREVVIRIGEGFSTGLRKAGAFLADGANVGCGCVLNPGTVIGRNSRVYPLTAVRGVIPPDHIVKSTENIVPME